MWVCRIKEGMSTNGAIFFGGGGGVCIGPLDQSLGTDLKKFQLQFHFIFASDKWRSFHSTNLKYAK